MLTSGTENCACMLVIENGVTSNNLHSIKIHGVEGRSDLLDPWKADQPIEKNIWAGPDDEREGLTASGQVGRHSSLCHPHK